MFEEWLGKQVLEELGSEHPHPTEVYDFVVQDKIRRMTTLELLDKFAEFQRETIRGMIMDEIGKLV